MKLTKATTLILVLLITVSNSFLLETQRIGRSKLKMTKRKSEQTKEFIELFKKTMEDKNLKVEQIPINEGGFGKIYQIEGKNFVAKSLQFSEDNEYLRKESVKKEIDIMLRIKTIKFALPLCDHFYIKKKEKEEGAALILPKAEVNLFEINREYAKNFEENKILTKDLGGLCGKVCRSLTNCFNCKDKTQQKIDENNKQFKEKLHQIIQIIFGLEYFHNNRKWVHGDIKLENYLIFNIKKEYKKVVLADFGLTKTELKDVSITKMQGTREYLPFFDFKARNKNNYVMPLNTKLDVYACGIVILRMLNSDLYETLNKELEDIYVENKPYSFEEYKLKKDKFVEELKKQRKDVLLPELQPKIEDLIIEKVLVENETRLSSKDLAIELEKLAPTVYADVENNYAKHNFDCTGGMANSEVNNENKSQHLDESKAKLKNDSSSRKNVLEPEMDNQSEINSENRQLDKKSKSHIEESKSESSHMESNLSISEEEERKKPNNFEVKHAMGKKK